MENIIVSLKRFPSPKLDKCDINGKNNVDRKDEDKNLSKINIIFEMYVNCHQYSILEFFTVHELFIAWC